MAVCVQCGKTFNPDKARRKFDEYFEDDDVYDSLAMTVGWVKIVYDDYYDGDVCYKCAKREYLDSISYFDDDD